MESDPIEETPPKRLKTGGGFARGQPYKPDDESADELFDDRALQFPETIPTQPLQRPCIPRSDFSSPPPHVTQPTQILNTPHRPNKISEILVPASSPQSAQRSTPQKSTPTYSIAPMAPPGTYYNPPIIRSNPFPNPPQSQLTDYDDPPIQDDSDSEDELSRSRSDIPHGFGLGRTSQNPSDQFRAMTSQFAYNPATAQKRPAVDTLSAYANASRAPKRQKQAMPARAVPVADALDIDLSSIQDWDMRQKATQIRSVFSGYPVTKIVEALRLKKGRTDDAMAHISEELEKAANPIDLTDSDIEVVHEVERVGVARLRETAPPKQTVKRDLIAPKQSLAEKYSRLPHKKLEPKLESKHEPSSPAPSTPPKPARRRLMQGRPPGRREPSSPVVSQPQTSSTPPTRKVMQVDSSDSEAEPEPEPESSADIEDRVLEFFRTCPERDLVDMASCTVEDAQLIISKRPFKNLGQVRRIAVENKSTKGKKRGGNYKTIGERIVDKVFELEEGLEAVDRLVKKCETYTEQIQQEMKKWGVDAAKSSGDDGLNIKSFDDAESDSTKHDSGIGTPSSTGEPGTKFHRSSVKLVSQPSNMSIEFKLKDYQVVGLNWLDLMWSKAKSWAGQSGCILADEMGLGKTMQVIAFLSHLLEIGEKGPHLIVVPASTLENWMREFRKFSPEIRFEPYHGKASERMTIQEHLEYSRDDVNVIVTTYNIAATANDNNWLRKFSRYSSCIFDEGHLLKNATSKRYEQLNKFKTGFRVLLTGTPLQNNLQELVSVLAFIMPRLFEERKEDLDLIFKHKAKTTDKDHSALLSAQRIERAKTILKPFILRRTKDQVLTDLPKKTNRVVYCEMTPLQQEIYQEYAEIHQQFLLDREAGKSTNDSARNTHMMARRLAAIHPLLVRRLYDDATVQNMVPKITRGRKFKGWSDIKMFEEFTWYSDFELHKICEENGLNKITLKNDEWMDSGKVKKLLELLSDFSEQGGRTLVFSQFVKVLNILEPVLIAQNIPFMRIDGDTPVDERQDLIDQFYGDETIKVFLITTKSGGAGINLACANKVIIFDSSFNPQDDVQAENRAHRIGQKREVEVVTLITKGTLEEQIYKLGQSKRALDKRVAGADSDEVAKDNEALLERMLKDGVTTPPEDETSAETKTGLEKDLKDAFLNGLKAKGIEVGD